MTPIQYALAEIRDRYPEEILRLAFIPKTRYSHIRERYNNTTVEYAILKDIINGRVRRNLNIYGAQEVTIRLDGLPQKMESYQAWSCHIPKHLTRGRSITQALSIHVGYANITGGGGTTGLSALGAITQSTGPQQCGVNQLTEGMQDILNKYKPMEIHYTSNVYLVGENTILCEDRMPMMNLVLRCMVESDDEFSMINGAYLNWFAEMCSLATEAYIYKNQRVVMDKASLEGGIEIGVIREWVDKFSDAEERYQEFLSTKGRKMMHLADKARVLRRLNTMIAPGI